MNQAELKQIAKICAEKIKNSEKRVNNFDIPFRHVVLDNFFPENFADSLYSNFPSLDSDTWDVSNDSDIEIKQRSTWK